MFDLLVQAYAKLKMFEIAFEVCCYLEEHGFSSNLISFNTLIHVVQKFDQVPLVWNIYEHMIQKRTHPNEVTIQTQRCTNAVTSYKEIKYLVTISIYDDF